MFQQIVSTLSMTPQAASQLTFYARRLKQESISRFFSVIAASLLVALQVLTVVSPATAANGTSPNDLVPGGFSSKADLLATYDKSASLQKIYATFGVTRANITSPTTVMTTINSRTSGTLLSVGQNPTTCAGEAKVVAFPSTDGSGTVFLRPLSCFDTGDNRINGSTYSALVGKKSDGSWFAILKNCANIVVKTPPPTPAYACTGLTRTPASGQVPLTVTFTAKSTFSGGAKPSGYKYNFGDGAADVIIPSGALSHTVNHAYAKAGTYTASVSVADTTTKVYKTASACRVTITATAKPTPTPTKTPTPTPTPSTTPTPTPTATPNVASLACVDLVGTPASGTMPLQVAFTASGKADNQAITDYIYTFGDGTTATTKTPKATHIYKAAGTYTAAVTVKGSLGATAPIIDSCKFEINVSEVPAEFVETKSAVNKTQNVDATTKAANPGDVITYTLSTKNTGGTAGNYTTSDDIADILEYAAGGKPSSLGGGTLNGTIISWPDDRIPAGETSSHSFEILVTSDAAVLARTISTSHPRSYDLKMDNVYGNPVSVDIVPPPSKQIEVAAQTMPETGPGESIALMIFIGGIVFFFYLRNRQLVTEIKLLRNEYQGDATHVS